MNRLAHDNRLHNRLHACSCQTHEGGISAVPGMEAHGGYAFCGLAALVLLEGSEQFDVDALAWWAVHRQMQFEGGFQGRTNKLVDGCYSFWVGLTVPCASFISHEGLRVQTCDKCCCSSACNL
eukprot:TRINITY_DN12245_c12_g1_i7.p1 TRINITY_DN12245_c12_g1~~TRINITY_DN12245_c12_g1_i7.p1  ORF type:complete len:123 (+),score=10.55 TRINITY_DN12245_c12_g1_i7:165-533(+)